MVANGLASTRIDVGQWLVVVPDGISTGGVQRIRFSPGATSATLSGRVVSGGVNRYVLGAMAGQTMTAHIRSNRGDVLLSIYGAQDGQILKRYVIGQPNTPWTGQLPTTQDYIVEAVSVGDSARYTLYVEIEAVETGEAATRIQFRPGSSSATVTGGVVLGSRNRYVLGARAGQTMLVNITSVEENAVFTIYAPGGQLLPGSEAGEEWKSWSGILPTTGDYTIVIGTTRGNASYSLAVTIR
jgi:hypothetical protein